MFTSTRGCAEPMLPFSRLKGKLSDSFTNYNYVGNTKVSVSIKKT